MTFDDRYSLVVLGETPGGIAAAVRAARQGLDTLLVTYHENPGGMMASGLSYTDTLTTKRRAPILEEFLESVREHYRTAYGPDSSQYDRCEDGYVFEPHVAQAAFEALLENEPELETLDRHAPVSVERSGRTLEALTLAPLEALEDGSSEVTDTPTVSADTFVEATYEGDLLAVAGTPYRVGRESRSKYGEQFAGKLFTRTDGEHFYPREAVGPGPNDAPADRRGPLDVPEDRRTGDLDLLPHPAGLSDIFAGSTGEGGDEIQAYNYRLCLSRDPENRRLPERPDGYDREEFLEALEEVLDSGLRPHLLLRYLPNEKADMNAADLAGENHDYPEADWPRRREIAREHRDHALGLLYFLQNDDEVPEEIREEAREWGLAADEFEENGNVPWQLYVREARRLEGRYTFTEDDGRLARGLERTPVHADSVAIAEYPLDSHACSAERRLGSHPDGHFYASQVTRPSQIPYRSLLPTDLDNLLVPVPLSASHVGFGTIRLEPTWMHIGEAAGWAVALASRSGSPPATLDVDCLQRTLAENGALLSFFNGHDAGTDEPWVPAVQYLGTKGLFDSYDADPDAPLTGSVAERWLEAAAELAGGGVDSSTEHARAVHSASGGGAVTDGDELEAAAFLEALADRLGIDPDDSIGADEAADPLTRARACELLYEALGEATATKPV